MQNVSDAVESHATSIGCFLTFLSHEGLFAELSRRDGPYNTQEDIINGSGFQVKSRVVKPQRKKPAARAKEIEAWRQMILRDSTNPIQHLVQSEALEGIIKNRGDRSIHQAVMDAYKESLCSSFEESAA